MKQYSFLSESFDYKKITNNKIARKFAFGLVGAKAASISAINTIVTKKILQIRTRIASCKTREEAERILLDAGYILKDDGTKEVKIASINYAVTDAVVGPSLQIVRNETDPMWKQHVLNYLKLMATSKGIKSIAAATGAAISTRSVFK